MAIKKETSALGDKNSRNNIPYYINDADLPDLPLPVRKLLEEYSKIPATQVQHHVLELRERAWRIFPYPCIGLLRFLDFSLSTMPSYPQILANLSRKHDPQTLLDVGCCFGQDLRKLLVDGAPGSQLVGAELQPDFISLGYSLFKDRETFKGRFVTGDVLHNTPASTLKALDGTIDVVHIASFLHLFGWNDQVKAAVRLVAFLKDNTGTMILGRQVGSSRPGESPHAAGAARTTYSHDAETFRKLWAEVETQTATKWKLETSLETVVTKGPPIELLYFEATRIE